MIKEKNNNIAKNLEDKKKAMLFEHNQLLKKYSEAKDYYHNIHGSLLQRIANLMEWKVKGETDNGLLLLIILVAEIVFKTGFGAIIESESGKGKTNLSNQVLKFIEPANVEKINNISLASVYREALEDPYKYDGLICNLGDKGGAGNDTELSEADKVFSAFLKELSSDGKMRKKLCDENNKVIVLDLEGHPCLLYTTVVRNNKDEQELSRNFTVVVNDNNIVPMLENNDNIIGKLKNDLEAIDNDIEIISYLFEYFKEEYFNINIVNLYAKNTGGLIESFGRYPNVGRDFKKLNYLLRCIALFNIKDKEILHDSMGEEYIFVDRNDVRLFNMLMQNYCTSLLLGINNMEFKVLKDIYDGAWDSCLSFNTITGEFEAPEDNVIVFDAKGYYNEHPDSFGSKGSVQKILSSLKQKGLIEVYRSNKDTLQTVYTVNDVFANSFEDILKNNGVIYEEADAGYVKYMLDNLDTGDYDELINYIENRFNKDLKYEISSLYEDGYPLPSWSDVQ